MSFRTIFLQRYRREVFLFVTINPQRTEVWTIDGRSLQLFSCSVLYMYIYRPLGELTLKVQITQNEAKKSSIKPESMYIQLNPKH